MAPRIEPDPYEPRPGGEFFGPEADWWHNAVVSAFHPSWYVYADGYRQAADLLVQAAAEDPSRNDILVYPIVFNYRQYVELSFKSMLRDAARLLNKQPPVFKSHDLDHVWHLLRPALLEAVGDGVGEIEWQVLSNCIEQLSRADPTSQTFRYPEQKDGAVPQYPHTHINLRQLRNQMSNAAKVIDSLGDYLVVLLDSKHEMFGDYGP